MFNLSENPITNTSWYVCKPSVFFPDLYLIHASLEHQSALYPVTTTLVDVQIYADSTILLGLSLESDLHSSKLSYSHSIDTALIFHHPRSQPPNLGLVWPSRKWFGCIIHHPGLLGPILSVCIDLLQAKKKKGAPPSLIVLVRLS